MHRKKLFVAIGLCQKKYKQGGLRTWNFHSSIKKEVEFPGVLKKNLCEISMGLCFRLWNFQVVPHNLAEFPGLKSLFSPEFLGVKLQI